MPWKTTLTRFDFLNTQAQRSISFVHPQFLHQISWQSKAHISWTDRQSSEWSALTCLYFEVSRLSSTNLSHWTYHSSVPSRKQDYSTPTHHQSSYDSQRVLNLSHTTALKYFPAGHGLEQTNSLLPSPLLFPCKAWQSGLFKHVWAPLLFSQEEQPSRISWTSARWKAVLSWADTSSADGSLLASKWGQT